MRVRASCVRMHLCGGKSFNLHFTDTEAQKTYSEGLFESDLQRHSPARASRMCFEFSSI